MSTLWQTKMATTEDEPRHVKFGFVIGIRKILAIKCRLCIYDNVGQLNLRFNCEQEDSTNYCSLILMMLAYISLPRYSWGNWNLLCRVLHNNQLWKFSKNAKHAKFVVVFENVPCFALTAANLLSASFLRNKNFNETKYG